jgi:hypothetical protein
MEEKICKYIGLIKAYNIEINLLFLRFEYFLLMLVKILVLPALNQWRTPVDTILLDSTKIGKSVEELNSCLLLKKEFFPWI